MLEADYVELRGELESKILIGARSVGILGLTPVALRLIADLGPTGLLRAVEAVYADLRDSVATTLVSVPVSPFAALGEREHDVLVVAADVEKEHLLRAAEPFIGGTPTILIGGHGHFVFRDRTLDEEMAQLLVPSLANGYPHCRPHLYQCLANAVRLDLHGVVAELGMFKGGTTMLLSRLIERLGASWKVLGFDTFEGFPPPRSFLDMYAHPDCVFTDLEAVRRYLDGRNVEIIPGDIVQTCARLAREDLVLTFFDTDNYTPASAALRIVVERTVVGGAIVFDHFTGANRFRYTLGERMAASALLEDARYFHLHGTGVFYRQR